MTRVRNLFTRAAEEYHQARWWLGVHREAGAARRRRVVRAGQRLPALPRQRRIPGRIWGVTMVRDEVDVLGATLEHLFAQGVDDILVADNLSEDGTRELLASMATKDRRLHLAFDDEPAYHQAEKMTALARAATRAGADWIVPFDADEFWFAESGTVAEHLRALAHSDPRAGVVRATFHNMVPTGLVDGPLKDTEFVIDSTPLPPGKVALRAHPLATIHVGNHFAQRVGTTTEGLHIAHAAYRSPTQVARKVRQGAAAVMLTNPGETIAPYWRAGATITDEDLLPVWEGITRGEPEPRLGLLNTGPMVVTTPLRWASWDPDGLLG